MRTKGTVLDRVVLALLDQAPRSGYDLRKAIVDSPLRHFSDSPGAIYPALRRLAARRWIDAAPPGGARRRRAFRLNPRGREVFLAWLREPVTPEDAALRAEDLLLRFAFMGQALPAGEIKRFLAAYERHTRAYVAVLERYFADYGDGMSATGRLAFRYGVEQFRSRVRWSRRASRSVGTRRSR